MRPLSLNFLQPSHTPRESAALHKMADLRGRLTAFYQRHNPTNLAQIDAILTAWGHNESELWR